MLSPAQLQQHNHVCELDDRRAFAVQSCNAQTEQIEFVNPQKHTSVAIVVWQAGECLAMSSLHSKCCTFTLFHSLSSTRLGHSVNSEYADKGLAATSACMQTGTMEHLHAVHYSLSAWLLMR